MKPNYKLYILLLLMPGVVLTTTGWNRKRSSTPDFSDVNIQVIIKNGGHIAWNKNDDILAFDRLGKDGYFDLWIADFTGKDQTCITCDHANLPNKHIGQPAWHPSGKFLVIQVQKPNMPKRFDDKAVPGAGLLNDLWIITADGIKTWRLYAVKDEISKDSKGILHPHFSHNGKMLFWSERLRSNDRPFGEWILRLADFSFDRTIRPRLRNIRKYNPGGKSSFFESHNFSPDDKYVLFTGNQDGPLEIYELNISDGTTKRLTHNPRGTWDEHAQYSPDGEKIVWVSSKGLRCETNPFFLQTEFWMMNRDGSNKQRLTYFHDSEHRHYLGKKFAVAADSDWNNSGTKIVGLVITNPPDTKKRGSGINVLIDQFTIADVADEAPVAAGFRLQPFRELSGTSSQLPRH